MRCPENTRPGDAICRQVLGCQRMWGCWKASGGGGTVTSESQLIPHWQCQNLDSQIYIQLQIAALPMIYPFVSSLEECIRIITVYKKLCFIQWRIKEVFKTSWESLWDLCFTISLSDAIAGLRGWPHPAYGSQACDVLLLCCLDSCSRQPFVEWNGSYLTHLSSWSNVPFLAIAVRSYYINGKSSIIWMKCECHKNGLYQTIF